MARVEAEREGLRSGRDEQIKLVADAGLPEIDSYGSNRADWISHRAGAGWRVWSASSASNTQSCLHSPWLRHGLVKRGVDRVQCADAVVAVGLQHRLERLAHLCGGHMCGQPLDVEVMHRPVLRCQCAWRSRRKRASESQTGRSSRELVGAAEPPVKSRGPCRTCAAPPRRRCVCTSHHLLVLC